MPRPPLALLLLVAGCGGAPAGGGGDPGAGAGPAFTARETERDFGRVWAGEVLEHEFVLAAGGPRPATVRRVSSDCGCTVAELALAGCSPGSPDTIVERVPYEVGTPVPPGGRLLVRAAFDTRGRSGPQVKRVTVSTSTEGGGDGGTTVLALRADVREWLRVEPPAVTIGGMSTRERREARFEVSSATGERFRLAAPDRRALPEAVRVELEPVRPDADGRASAWRALAVLGPGMPAGARTLHLELASDRERPGAAPESSGASSVHAAEPAVHVIVHGPVELSPPALSFGVLSADEVASRSLRVVGHDAETPLPAPRARLEPVEPAGDGAPFPLAETARIEIRPVAGENAHELEIVLDGLADAVERSFLARLVVETGHPDAPVLEALVSGLRKAGTRRGGR